MVKRDGKLMGTAKIGPKGQIVIPKEMRDMFSLECGDTVVLMADAQKGIAVQTMKAVESMIDAAFSSGNDGTGVFARDLNDAREDIGGE